MVGRAAPFPTPPGLELGAPGLQRPAEAMDSDANSLDDLRVSLLRDVDETVAKKVEEIWAKGQQMMAQVQLKHQEKTDKLAAEISQCLEKQRKLELENQELKQVLAQLAGSLSVLGVAFGGAAATCAPSAGCVASPGAATTTTAAGSSVASTPPQLSSPSELFTPSKPTGDTYSPLPEVPAFPFPAQLPHLPPGPPAPLSLAEALGADVAPAKPAQAPTPLSLANSLVLPSPAEVASTYGVLPTETVFSFTIRKADHTDLGLKVSHHEHDQALTVDAVLPDGAVEAWNRQCLNGTFPERVVRPGDKIVSVNNVSRDPEKMLDECKEKQLLRLTVERGNFAAPEFLAPVGASTPVQLPAASNWTSLRADASEFVPMGAASPSAATQASEGCASGAVVS